MSSTLGLPLLRHDRLTDAEEQAFKSYVGFPAQKSVQTQPSPSGFFSRITSAVKRCFSNPTVRTCTVAGLTVAGAAGIATSAYYTSKTEPPIDPNTNEPVPSSFAHKTATACLLASNVVFGLGLQLLMGPSDKNQPLQPLKPSINESDLSEPLLSSQSSSSDGIPLQTPTSSPDTSISSSPDISTSLFPTANNSPQNSRTSSPIQQHAVITIRFDINPFVESPINLTLTPQVEISPPPSPTEHTSAPLNSRDIYPLHLGTHNQPRQLLSGSKDIESLEPIQQLQEEDSIPQSWSELASRVTTSCKSFFKSPIQHVKNGIFYLQQNRPVEIHVGYWVLSGFVGGVTLLEYLTCFSSGMYAGILVNNALYSHSFSTMPSSAKEIHEKEDVSTQPNKPPSKPNIPSCITSTGTKICTFVKNHYPSLLFLGTGSILLALYSKSDPVENSVECFAAQLGTILVTRPFGNLITQISNKAMQYYKKNNPNSAKLKLAEIIALACDNPAISILIGYGIGRVPDLSQFAGMILIGFGLGCNDARSIQEKKVTYYPTKTKPFSDRTRFEQALYLTGEYGETLIGIGFVMYGIFAPSSYDAAILGGTGLIVYYIRSFFRQYLQSETAKKLLLEANLSEADIADFMDEILPKKRLWTVKFMSFTDRIAFDAITLITLLATNGNPIIECLGAADAGIAFGTTVENIKARTKTPCHVNFT
ncbi:MAG: hypothetical protein P4L16_05410 [Chlamydiales bacterium]|nr:hypothetical protein [Chlamydiales bacterium]